MPGPPARPGPPAPPDASALPALRPLALRAVRDCAHPVLAAVVAELRARTGAGDGAYFSDAPAAGAYFADTPSPGAAGVRR
ncbi:hypothetical protein ACFWXK_31490 [Streptomyces sp. NPDC059070]|uniref:hypothetical protein n=1 Tax=unclassified Streptomyces TaxID=2593676 RepID=UPI0034E1BE60